jgi:hypothetical protein
VKFSGEYWTQRYTVVEVKHFLQSPHMNVPRFPVSSYGLNAVNKLHSVVADKPLTSPNAKHDRAAMVVSSIFCVDFSSLLFTTDMVW